jgi:hypothetical protein
MRVLEAREEGLLEIETHLADVPIEWVQEVLRAGGGVKAMEWEVRAWLEQHAGLDIGEATAIFQRARALFAASRQDREAMRSLDNQAFIGDPVPARFRLLPAVAS